ncbi:hypothetical protein [Halorhabdus rudnickae]|uniref:hypothetical protein n=1 Tax=Halorhabdus rudnickae TaxID=1775544 RepID=UPI0010844E2E|nr:hypothetical protein [Halorhabdus rudnickae]
MVEHWKFQDDPTDTGVDVDSDYLDVGESESVDDCYEVGSGDPKIDDSYASQGRSISSKRQWEEQDSDSPLARTPQSSPARTDWKAGEVIDPEKGWDYDKKGKGQEKNGNKYRFQMGLDVRGATGKEMRTSKINGDKEIEAVVSAILGNGALADDVIYDVSNAPESEKKSWNPDGGHKAMVVGYCGYAVGDDVTDATQTLLDEVNDDVFDGLGMSDGEVLKSVRKAFNAISERQTHL